MTIVKNSHGITIAILLAALQIQGCATPVTDQLLYEREARTAERTDEIRGFITACQAAGMIVMYDGPSTHKLRDPIKHISRNAHNSDYTCASQPDFDRILR